MIPTSSKVKMFFDMACPNSWISFKMIQKNKELLGIFDFVPVSEYTMELVKSGDINRTKQFDQKRREPAIEEDGSASTTSESAEPGVQPEVSSYRTSKWIHDTSYPIRTDWQEIRSRAFRNGSMLTQTYLTSIKLRIPDKLVPSIDIIGRRLWEDGLPVCKGAHLSRCAREAGISFQDSEDIISRLSHRDNKAALSMSSREAVIHKIKTVPIFVLTQPNTIDQAVGFLSDLEDMLEMRNSRSRLATVRKC